MSKKESFEITSLPMDQIFPSPTNPRKRFDIDELEQLSENIVKVGVLQPILVRPFKGRYEIVAGERRYRACKLAFLEEIPVRVKDLTDDEVIEVQMVENLQRSDMHPLEEADGYKVMLGLAGNDITAVAAKVSKSESTIHRRLKLLDLEKQVRKAYLADEINTAHAELIARLQPKDQIEAFAECFDVDYHGNGKERIVVSAKALERWIASNVFLDLNAAAFPKDASLGKVGPCVTCVKRTGFVPSLFPDIAHRDTCTDRVCFQKKQAAHLKQAEATLKAEHGKVIKISESHAYGSTKTANEKAGILDAGDYKPVGKKKCDHTAVALHTDGAKVGHTSNVCLNKKCKVHNPASFSYQQTPEEKAAQEKAKFERTVETAALSAGIKALVYDDELLELDEVFRFVAEGLFEYRRAEVFQTAGIEDGPLEEFQKHELFRLIVTGSILNRAHSDRTKKFVAGQVDMKAITKSVRAELKAEEKTKAAAKPSKGKKPTKGQMAAANDHQDEDEDMD